MPTGYTAAIQDGEITTLRDYALRCARAFGALVTMRDEPMDAPIPQQLQPDTRYHDEKIATAKAILHQVRGLNADECERRAAAAGDAAMKQYDEYRAERDAKKKRYQEMLDKVRNWCVPVELRPLQDFMAKQIEESISFDCLDYDDEAPMYVSGFCWRANTLQSAERDIVYHTERRNEEIARVAERNAWLKMFFDALPPEGTDLPPVSSR